MTMSDCIVVGIITCSTIRGGLNASLPSQENCEDVEWQTVRLEQEKAIPKYEVMFEDSFNSDNEGRGNLHYRGFKNWFVTRGEVDLVGSGFRYYDSEHNLYADLNGTEYCGQSGIPGALQSKGTFVLKPGTYVLKFDLACNPQQIEGKVNIRLANVFQESFSLNNGEYCGEFKTETHTISVSKLTKGKLIFEYQGQNWGDILLDNVRLLECGSHRKVGLSEGILRKNMAEQLLNDISDAEVVEKSEDLNHAFRSLNEICERAIETCSAMLSARYDYRQDESVNNEKGNENGNE